MTGFHNPMMVRTDQHQIPDRRFPTSPPRNHVMGLTRIRRNITTREHTTLITLIERGSDLGCDKALIPAHIKHARRATQHHRQHVCFAQEPPQSTRIQPVTRSHNPTRQQPMLVSSTQQHVVIEGHDHPRPVPTLGRRQLISLVGMNERDQPIRAPHRRTDPLFVRISLLNTPRNPGSMRIHQPTERFPSTNGKHARISTEPS